MPADVATHLIRSQPTRLRDPKEIFIAMLFKLTQSCLDRHCKRHCDRDTGPPVLASRDTGPPVLASSRSHACARTARVRCASWLRPEGVADRPGTALFAGEELTGLIRTLMHTLKHTSKVPQDTTYIRTETCACPNSL